MGGIQIKEVYLATQGPLEHRRSDSHVTFVRRRTPNRDKLFFSNERAFFARRALPPNIYELYRKSSPTKR